MGQVSSNSLITAAKQNLVDEVRALLSFGIDVERMNEQRNNALHVACFAGHHLVPPPPPPRTPPSLILQPDFPLFPPPARHAASAA